MFGSKLFAKKKTQGAQIETKALPVAGRMLALEPRFVFDAAIATELHDLGHATTTADHALPGAHESGDAMVAASRDLAERSQPVDLHRAPIVDRSIEALITTHNLAPSNHEIAFIDSRLADLDVLINSVSNGTRIVLIDGSRDGVAQMVDALRGEHGITGIHILSHGSEGHIQLGTSTIDEATMSSVYRSALTSIHGNLAQGADILVYGCDFGAGADGSRAAAMLASLTGADVAASTNLTGAADKGGDWVLEEHVGTIDAKTIDAKDWLGELTTSVNIGKGALLSATGNNIYSIDIATGKAMLVTTVPGTVGGIAVSGVINSFAVDQVNGLIYYIDNASSAANVALFAYDFVNNQHIVVSSDVRPFGITVNTTVGVNSLNTTLQLGMGGAGATFANGKLYLGVEDNWTSFTDSIYAITMSANGKSITSASRLNTSLPVVNDWGDLGYDPINNVLLNFVGSNNTLTRVDPTTGATLSSVNLPAGSGFQGSQDQAGNVYTVGTSIMQINPTTGAQIGSAVAITTNGTTALGSSNDAGGWTPPTAVVSGTVFVDANSNATKDAGEVGIANVTVQLYTDINNDGVINGSDSSIGTDTTDANGLYQFTGVLPGNYIVKVTDANGVITTHTYTTAGNNINANADVSLIGGVVSNLNFGIADAPPVLDLDTSAAGTGYATTYTEGGAAVAIGKLAATTITDTDDANMKSATVVLTNKLTGDQLSIGGSVVGNGSTGTINGIAYTVTDVGGVETISLTGSATKAVYQTTLDAITFSSTIQHPSTTDRIVNVTVSDGLRSSNTATATISVVDLNHPPVANPDSVETAANTPVIVNLLANDTDPDGDPLTVTAATVPAAQGTLAQDPVTHAYTFTPAAGFTGTATINYTIQDQYGATSSSTHTVFVNAPPALVDPDVGPTTPFINPADPANLVVPATDNVPVSLHLDTYFADPNGDPMTFTPNMAGAPAWLSYDPVTHTLSGTPPVDNVGPVTIPVSVTDGHGNTFASTITIAPVNPAPTANPDSVETAANTPVIVNLLANDTDPDGDPVTVTSASVPAAQGTLAQDPVTHVYTFTPAAGFTGTATISYTIQDQDGATSSSTHTVIVNAPPALTDPDVGPTTPFINPADPANLVVPATDNVPVSLHLDTYFADPNGDPMTFTPNMAGAPAWLSYDPVTHTLSGTPPVDNVGPVTIPVSVTDGHGNTFASTITIAPVNPAPTANPDSVETAANTPVIVNLLANDTDPDGDPVTVTSASVPAAQGTLAQDPVTHVYTFTPAAGFTGTATISYTIQDQDGATSSSTHTVIVNAPPALTDPDVGPTTPFINPADPANLVVPATDNVPVSLHLDTYFADPNGDPMTFTPNMAGAPAWLSYDPVTHTLSGTPPVDNVGPVTIPVSVTDGHGNTFASTITIAPVNPAPTANPDSVETAANTPVIVNLLANDTDPDGDPLTVTSASVPAAQGTLAQDPVTHVYTFTPAAGFTGTATISYTIQDQDGATSSSTHTVIVNAPPALTDPDVGPTTPFINPADPANLVVPATDNVPVSLHLDTYFADPNGDPMTFTPNMAGAPAWLSYDPVTHTLAGTPPVDNVGPVTIPVSVTDGHGNTFASTITFSPVNPAPTANPDSVETAKDTPVIVNLLANDTDPDGDPLTVTSATVNPAQGTLAQDPVTHVYTFTPAAGFTGTATISYTIQDQDGATSSSTHAVIVNAPPALTDPDVGPTTPFINPADPANLVVPATDNVPVSLHLDTYFADPNGDPMTFTPNMAGAPAWLSYDPVTHTLSGTPPVDNVGPVTIPVSVTDGHGNTFASTITFSPVNPAPTANPDSVETAKDTPVIVNLLANDTDPDGDPLTVTSASVPAAQGTLAQDPVTHVYTFTPAAGFTGTATISYTIQDQDGATSSSTHTVIVNAPPALTDPDVGPTTPFINPADPANLVVPATDNVPVSLHLDTYFADPNGDPMTFTPNMAGAPAWLSYDPVTHTLAGAPPVDNVGPVTIPVSVTDGHGNTFASTITFSPVNPAPTANPDSVETAKETPVIVNLLANDADPDGDPLTVTSASVPAAQGTLAQDPVTHVYTFTPAAGFTGTATISYTIQDQDGATSSSTHTVIVNAPPALTDPDVGPTTPFINPADPANLVVPATDNVPVSLHLDTYFADPNGDPMTFTPNMAGAPAWLSYDPVTHTLAGTPPVDNVGPVTIPVSVTDGHGNTFASTITFSPVNPAPTANPDSVETAKDTPVIVNLLANDADPDGDPLTVTSASVPAAQGTLAQDPVTHVYTFTPAAGFTGTATISYTIQDQDGATSSSTHTVIVNAPPALTDPDVGPTTPFINPADPANLVVPATDNVSVSLHLDTYYADPNGDPMTFTPNMTGAPAWLSYDPVTHTLSGTPPVDNVGPVTIPVSVTDGHGNTFASTITFSPVNPAPTANPDSVTTAYITPVAVDLLANDTDPDGDPLTVTSATVNPAQGTLSQDPVTHVYTFTPAAGFTGTATISYTIQDQDGATSSSTHTVIVNAPPLSAVDDNYSTAYVTPLHGDASSADTFANGSTFTVATGAGHGTVVMTANGTYVYTPAAGFAGTDTFSYRVTDPTGQTVVATEHITVAPPAIQAVNDSYETAFRAPLVATAAAADNFAPGSTFVATSLPVDGGGATKGTVTMNANGGYTYTPPQNFAGTVTFTYRITDPVGQTATATETIIVRPPPIIATNDTHTTTLNGPLAGNVASNDTFASGSVFSKATNPAHGTVTMNPDGTFRYIPARNFSGTDTFTYTITDPTGQTITATETITISPRPPLQKCLTTFGRITGFVPRRR